MLKIEELQNKDISLFRTLLMEIFDEGFDYYPPEGQKYNKNHWTETLIGKYLKRDDFLFLLAAKDNKPVGYLIGKLTSYGATILWLGVLKDFRNRNIGSKLVNYWQDWAKLQGAELLKLSTADFQNEHFYQKLGFSKKTKLVKNDWGMEKIVFVKKV